MDHAQLDTPPIARTPTRIYSLIVWTVATLNIIASLAGMWLYNQLPERSPESLLWVLLIAVLPTLVGVLILARKPGHWVGLWLMIGGLCYGIGELLLPGYVLLAVARGRIDLPLLYPSEHVVQLAWIVGFLALAQSVLYFPTGTLPSPRWRWVPVLTVVSVIAMVTLTLVVTSGQTLAQLMQGDAVLTQDQQNMTVMPFFMALISIIGAVAGFVARLRRAFGVERQQLKWFGLFFALFLLLQVGNLIVQNVSRVLTGASYDPVRAVIGQTGFDLLFALSIAAWFISMAVAILRHKAMDIDIVIRRTLIYGALSLLLAALYVGLITALQQGLVALTGRGDSQLVTVISTLAVAGAFLPLRNRVQAFVDRRFYRRKYDAALVAARFAGEMRDTVTMNDVTTKLFDAVEETMQPGKTVLWVAEERKAK